MLLAVIVHPAHVQDRDGAEPLLRQARRLFPSGRLEKPLAATGLI